MRSVVPEVWGGAIPQVRKCGDMPVRLVPRDQPEEGRAEAVDVALFAVARDWCTVR